MSVLLQEMAEDFDIEALLEAPYNKGVRKNIFSMNILLVCLV